MRLWGAHVKHRLTPLLRPARVGVVVGALVVLAMAATIPTGSTSRAQDPRPSIVVIVTDDQDFTSLLGPPAAMPWLQNRLRKDPNWYTFDNAFVNTPLCCPSRATILTGLNSRHSGVQRNSDGRDGFDDSETLAVWLQQVGYWTGLVGKYLNRYPWDLGPFVPPGWDEWVAKANRDERTVYYGYDIVTDETTLHLGRSPEDYSTDWLAGRALDFIREAPSDRPFFLYFAPSAPHRPWTAAPRDAGALEGARISSPTAREYNDVREKPAWARSLPRIGVEEAAVQQRNMRGEYETLLAVDDALRRIVRVLDFRGELKQTLIFLISDNGWSFGVHRWEGKKCAWQECTRVPMAARVPAGFRGSGGHVADMVSNTDLAPTIVEMAQASAPFPFDGVSLVPVLNGGHLKRPALLLDWVGDNQIPAWSSVRTRKYTYIENKRGTTELYDLKGDKASRPDPGEMRNRFGDPRYDGVVDRLARLLRKLQASG